jgi:hypothetical protein
MMKVLLTLMPLLGSKLMLLSFIYFIFRIADHLLSLLDNQITLYLTLTLFFLIELLHVLLVPLLECGLHCVSLRNKILLLVFLLLQAITIMMVNVLHIVVLAFIETSL